MRARIIFQGLTLFTFDKSTADAKAGDNAGTLIARLVSNPDHASMPLHKHTPRMGVSGRDVGDKTSAGRVSKNDLRPSRTDRTTVELKAPKAPKGRKGQTEPRGVTLDGSFLDYVPCLSQLHWGTSRGIRNRFVTATIVIPTGRVRARNFIGWDWHGNTAARIGYMGTTFQGFGANEVVVDIGDDNDFDIPSEKRDPKRFLSIAGPDVQETLWPRIVGAPTDEDMDPNTVEVVFTNFPARRLRAAPHGLHFETVCDAAGYKGEASRYENTDQYTAFKAAMEQYDSDAWSYDVGMMGIGQPFPYLINPGADLLDPLRPSGIFSKAMTPPPTPGRRAGEGIAPDDSGQHQHDHGATGDDPDNTVICPHGRE